MAAKVIILRSNGNGLNVINDVMKTKTPLINNNSIQRSLSADILFFAYPERPSKFEKRLLNSLDTFLSLFIITPLVVAHWRGTWDFMDQYAEHFPAWNCFILGSVLHVLFTLLRETLHAEFVQPSPGRQKTFRQKLRQFMITKAYTYCFSVGCIMQWRGGWDVIKGYFGLDLRVALGMSIMCLIPLIMVKGLRNLLAVPMVIITDIKEFTFSFPTRFRTEVSKNLT